MRHSKIGEHENTGKELIPPFLKGEMGNLVQLHSWSKERVPEYVWLGLLRDSCSSKKEFFDKFYFLKDYILEKFEEPIDKFSIILDLNENDKIEIFEKIKNFFGDYVLDPLIIVSYYDESLRKCYFNKKISNNERIKKIKDVVTKMYERYDDFAMDVRYCAIILKLNKIRFNANQTIMINAIQKYPFLDNDSPELSLYRTSLSAFEGIDPTFDKEYKYSKYFYEEMYLMTDCKPVFLDYGENESLDELNEKMRDLRKLLIKSNEIKYDDKREVIVGNITYIYKMINEIISNNLGNSIVSRLVLRTIAEIYVNIKFLVLKSKNEEKIWESFKDYGSGKYKMIYKKIDEGISIADNCTHFNKDLLGLFANENKSEEFIKISFKNFADKNVRQKFQDVGEKDLYDTYYDYDTCFCHGYWGAIRESSLLLCDNAIHNYHSVPDTDYNQKLMCCYSDLCFLVDHIIEIMNNELEVN